MHFDLLVTNNSPRHSARTWAEVSAKHIISLFEIKKDGGTNFAARALDDIGPFEREIADCLENYHEEMQSEGGASIGLMNCMILQAIEEIVYAAEINGIFARHFKRQVVQDAIREILERNFRTQLDIERQIRECQQPV